MFTNFMKLLKLFARGVIYGNVVISNGGDAYIAEAAEQLIP